MTTRNTITVSDTEVYSKTTGTGIIYIRQDDDIIILLPNEAAEIIGAIAKVAHRAEHERVE